MCPGSQKRQMCPVVHQAQHHQPVKEGDCSAVQGTGTAHLKTCVQLWVPAWVQGYEIIRASPEDGDQGAERPRGIPSGLLTAILMQGQWEVNLRATDVKLMRQLLLINESIESIKWMIEEKAIASRGSSLSGSLCSLLESQETSLHGSCNSLQDCSDGLDGISVGSYLDTLVDDVPGHQTPSDLDKFSDSSVTEDSQSLHKHPKIDSDEYYCFG
nr:leucine rich adaptor protein 1-like [Zonotrichia albicollis]